mgnify:CR=1 FL=1
MSESKKRGAEASATQQTVAGALDATVGSPARDQAASIGTITDLDEIFRDFNDPRRKWRRLLAEFVGTFFLVLVAAGLIVPKAKAAWGFLLCPTFCRQEEGEV